MEYVRDSFSYFIFVLYMYINIYINIKKYVHIFRLCKHVLYLFLVLYTRKYTYTYKYIIYEYDKCPFKFETLQNYNTFNLKTRVWTIVICPIIRWLLDTCFLKQLKS